MIFGFTFYRVTQIQPMYSTTAIRLKQDDMMYIWLTYISMHFSEF